MAKLQNPHTGVMSMIYLLQQTTNVIFGALFKSKENPRKDFVVLKTYVNFNSLV